MTALHPCGYHDPITGESGCDLPARLYELPNGNRVRVCEGHAFAIEDLLEVAR